MMARIGVLLGFIFSLATFASYADEIAKTRDGRQVLLNDDGTYKFIVSEDTGKSEYGIINITDLKLDIKDMIGDKVQVEASLMHFGDMVMLSDPRQLMDGSPIIASQEHLSRTDREFILKNCAMGCVVSVQGRVSRTMYESGVELHSLVR